MKPEETRGICGDIGGGLAGTTSGDELGSAGGLKFWIHTSYSDEHVEDKQEATNCFLALPVDFLQ